MGGTTRTRRSRPGTRDENAYFLLKKKVGKENFHPARFARLLIFTFYSPLFTLAQALSISYLLSFYLLS